MPVVSKPVAMLWLFRYEYGDDLPTRQPDVTAMIPRLFTMLLFAVLWCSASAAESAVTMTVEKCAGTNGPVGRDSMFGCMVEVKPPDVTLTVYAYSSCAVSPGPQTVSGKARLLFRTKAAAQPGHCSVTLFAVNDASGQVESSMNADVEIQGVSPKATK